MQRFDMIFHRDTDDMDDMFETCVKSLRKHYKGYLRIWSNNIPQGLLDKWEKEYDINWTDLDLEPAEAIKTMSLQDNLRQVRTIQSADDGDQLISSDIDLYFMADPFTAFDKAIISVGIKLLIDICFSFMVLGTPPDY